jgi:hypothetical protein
MFNYLVSETRNKNFSDFWPNLLSFMFPQFLVHFGKFFIVLFVIFYILMGLEFEGNFFKALSIFIKIFRFWTVIIFWYNIQA